MHYSKGEKNMKNTTKLLTMLLAIVMVLSVLASCGETPVETTPKETTAKTPDTTKAPDVTTPEATEPDSSEPETSESEETTPEETVPDETTQIKDLTEYLPEDINLGVDMSIFAERLYDEEWLDKDDGDLVGTELYNRVLRVEKALGIELTVTLTNGTANNTEWYDEAKKRQESTDPNMIADLISGYSQMVGTFTLEGRLQNIANSDDVDFENPWWPAALLENSTIDDKVYFASGDISPTLLYEIYAIFYNRALIEKYNLEDPIKLVNTYKWTLDKLISMTEGIYEDLNNDKTANIGDFTAFNFCDNAHLKAFPYAMGVRVLEPDDDDGYVWSESYMGERMDVFIGKFVPWVQNNSGVTVQSEFYDFGVNFRAGNNIFTVGNFGFAKGEAAGSGIDYAVVPCPMYDEEQKAYYSTHGNPCSFWGIPNNADLDNSAILLERLAVDAYVYITPALFERALKLKYVTNDVDGIAKMFDIIRYGVVFDAALIYNQSLKSYKQYSELAGLATSWGVFFDQFTRRAMKREIGTIVDTLRKLP